MTTKQKCEAFATQHNLSLEVSRGREWGELWATYSIDLPDDQITESGMRGRAGDLDDGSVETMAEVWQCIWEDMQLLVAERWVNIADADKFGISN